MARKYKQVHRKEIDFSLEDWAVVERRAAACGMKTGTYLRRIALNGSVKTFDLKGVAPLINGMRTISNNINQIARKANETNSIFAEDMRKIKTAQDELSHILAKFICNCEWNEV